VGSVNFSMLQPVQQEQ